MRPDDGGHIVQGGRNFLAALLLVALFQLAMSPAMFGWTTWSTTCGSSPAAETVQEWAPWVIGAAWLHGLLIGGIGIAIGVRNFRKLTRPQQFPLHADAVRGAWNALATPPLAAERRADRRVRSAQAGEARSPRVARPPIVSARPFVLVIASTCSDASSSNQPPEMVDPPATACARRGSPIRPHHR